MLALSTLLCAIFFASALQASGPHGHHKGSHHKRAANGKCHSRALADTSVTSHSGSGDVTASPAAAPVIPPNATPPKNLVATAPVPAPKSSPPVQGIAVGEPSSPSFEPAKPGDLWNKTSEAQGKDILDFFNFETANTGTQGGSAQYVSLEEATSLQLVQILDNSVRFNVETTKYVSGTRKSIRASSKNLFNANTLIVVDVEHIPAACGAWPALWTVARDGSWPDKGEIDIIEGVNLFTQNGLSVHTKDGFWMKDTGFSAGFMMSSDNKNNCAALATNDQGCGLRDSNTASMGAPFNANKGGVFVLDWTDDVISIFFFSRGNVPQDIASGAPNKSSAWRSSKPHARFQDTNGQKTSNYFMEHVLVVNTNLCGNWPEGVWSADASYAGQSQSCAQQTGFGTCADFMRNAGDQLSEAYWSLNSIRTYN